MEKIVRILALVLSVAGILWGMFAFRMLQYSKWAPQQLLIWMPGYLVTIGYVIRATSNPRGSVRIAIWILSLLVQGFWFNRGIISFGPFAVVLSCFVTVASALALFADLRPSDSKSA